MSVKRTLAGALLCVAGAAMMQAQNVFVVPTGSSGSAVMSIFHIDPLGAAAHVTGTATTIRILAAPDGSQYITVDSSGTVNVLSGSDFHVVNSQTFGPVKAAALSADGSRLALAGSTLTLVDVASLTGVTVPDASTNLTDVAVSIDSTTVFAVSTISKKLTAVNISTGSVIATVDVTGGLYSDDVLSVAPNGTVYVSAQNRVYGYNPRTLTRTAEIAVNGNPGRLAFNADGSIALSRDVYPGNRSVFYAFDLVNKNATTVSSNTLAARFDSMMYGGKNGQGLERWFGFSRTAGSIYEITYPALSANIFAGANGIQGISGVAASSEVTGPLYLIAASGDNKLYRMNLGNGTKTSADIGGPNGTLMVAGAASTAAAATLQVLSGANQTVAADADVAPIAVRILDATGRPVANAPVTITGPTGMTFTNASNATNGFGYAFATPDNPGSGGQYTITIKSGVKTTTTVLTVTGSSNGGGNPSGDATGLSIVSGNGQIGASASPLSEPLVVQLRDEAGTPVANATVTFEVDALHPFAFIRPLNDSSGGPLGGMTCTGGTSCTGKTDVNGLAKVAILMAGVSDVNSYQRAVINVTAGTLSVSATEIARGPNGFINTNLVTPADPGTALQVPAGGTLPAAIKIFVNAGGAFGNGGPVSGVQVEVYTPYNDPYDTARNGAGPTATCGGNASVTNTQGLATCDIVAGPVQGNTEIRAYVGGGSGRLYRLTNFTVAAGQASKVNIIRGNNQTLTPGQTATALVGQVVDAGGNALSGVSVTWTAPQGLTLQNAGSTTNQQGQVSALPVIGSTPGTFNVVLKAGANASATFKIVVNASLGALTVVSGNNQSTQPGTSFSAPLVVKLTNSTGGPAAGVGVNFAITTGSGTLSASSAVTDANGLAQITVTAPSTEGNLVVTASVASLPSQTFSLSAQARPVFDINNLLNGAGFQRQSGVAPGQILTITGTGIASGIQGVIPGNNVVGPLPTTLAGVTVTFNGIAAPIFYVANLNGAQRVTVQVPFELQPGTNTNIAMTVNGGTTTINSVPVLVAAPGTFTTTDQDGNTYGVAIHEDGTYVTISNPAHAGETVRVFATGLGEVTPSGLTNTPGLAGQTAVHDVLIGVGNGGTGVLGTEYAQGLLGVYLVTFQIPADAPTTGLVPLSVNVWPTDNRSDPIYGNTTTLPIR